MELEAKRVALQNFHLNLGFLHPSQPSPGRHSEYATSERDGSRAGTALSRVSSAATRGSAPQPCCPPAQKLPVPMGWVGQTLLLSSRSSFSSDRSLVLCLGCKPRGLYVGRGTLLLLGLLSDVPFFPPSPHTPQPPRFPLRF